jgi:hypothetical protein
VVGLDHQLVFEARRFITAANVHRVREMIFAYEQAVDLHNRKWHCHSEYQEKYERDLRAFVAAERRQRFRLVASLFVEDHTE